MRDEEETAKRRGGGRRKEKSGGDLLKSRRTRARAYHGGVANAERRHQQVDAWLDVLSVERLATGCERE